MSQLHDHEPQLEQGCQQTPTMLGLGARLAIVGLAFAGGGLEVASPAAAFEPTQTVGTTISGLEHNKAPTAPAPLETSHVGRYVMYAAGDSIVAGPAGGPSWPSDYGHLAHAKVIDVGHPGQCPSDIHCYYPEPLETSVEGDVWEAKPKADALVVDEGINQICLTGAGKIINVMREIDDEGDKEGVVVVNATITPLEKFFKTPEHCTRTWNRFNAWVRHNGRPYVDMDHALDNKQGYMQHRFGYGDGLHVNELGFKRMAHALLKVNVRDMIKALREKETSKQPNPVQ